jgi:MFS family permease
MFNKFGIKSKNISLMYLANLFGGMLFFLPIYALYLEKNLFSITNVALIFAIEAIAMVIFEIPTGAVADLFGRKKTMLVAHSFAILGIYVLYIGGSMAVFTIAVIIIALARSLSSGTSNALIYDTLKEEKKEKYYKKIIGTMYSMWLIGASSGSIVGGYLASIDLSLPFILTIIPMLISTIFLLKVKEPKYEKEENKNIFKHMFNSSKVIISNKQLIIIILATFIFFAFAESIHFMNALFFEFRNIPIKWFGYIAAFTFGCSAIGHYISHDVSEKFGNKKSLIFASLAMSLLILGAVFSPTILAVIFLSIAGIPYGIRAPISEHLLNLEVSSSMRATIISSANLMRSLGIAIVSPIVGYWADLYNIQTAFKFSGFALLIVPVIYFLLKDKK